MESAQHIQGRWVGTEEIAWLRSWVEEHPNWSRKRLARELCERWRWRDERQRLKDFAARSFLLKLEAQGAIRLPPLRLYNRRAPRSACPPAGWQAPAPWRASLAQLGRVAVERIVPGTPAARQWAFYLAQYHYLGLRVVGENVGYLARDGQGRDLACLLFGAPAWRCAPRDRVLGWSASERSRRLHEGTNNTRFLILPWVRVPHLASHVLGAVARRIDRDWCDKYGHGLRWLETFVERGRFAGTCYRAANWACVGQTRGRSRQDRDHTRTVPIKDIYLYRWGGSRGP
jgi:hypothetical protein